MEGWLFRFFSLGVRFGMGADLWLGSLYNECRIGGTGSFYRDVPLRWCRGRCVWSVVGNESVLCVHILRFYGFILRYSLPHTIYLYINGF